MADSSKSYDYGHGIEITLEILMNNDIAISVVSSLFGYYSGRFKDLPVRDEWSELLTDNSRMDGIIIDVRAGRDMTVVGLLTQSFHGPVLIKRYPADRQPNRDSAYNDALRELILAAVMTIKCVPDDMVFKTRRAVDKSGSWETPPDDLLGEVISAGLLARQCTYCIGAGEFSVHYEENGYLVGYNFKGPSYINNVFSLPTWIPHG